MAGTQPRQQRVTHCLFDMDGLLLDTETFYTIVQQNILAKHGKQFTWALKAKMMGKKALEAAQVRGLCSLWRRYSFPLRCRQAGPAARRALPGLPAPPPPPPPRPHTPMPTPCPPHAARAQVLIDDLQLEGQLTPEDFVAQREEELDRMFPTAQLMPGAERLLRHLKDSGVPIAVATSSHARHFAAKTQNHTQLFGLFDHIVTGDQARAGSAAVPEAAS